MQRKVPESIYRCSRICRVLGNPTAYEILSILANGKQRPTALSQHLKVSIPTISQALRSLRNLDLVRYENTAEGKYYSIKEGQLLEVMDGLTRVVRRQQRGEY